MSRRHDRLWPVLSVLVGLLSGVGFLEAHARRRETETLVVEIHGNGADEDGAAEATLSHPAGPAQAKARTEALRGDVAGAIARLEAEVAAHPPSAALLTELGHWQSVDGRARDAVDNLTRAKALAPRDTRVAYELGAALRKAGRLPEAEAELSRALTLNASHGGARVALGELYRRRGAIAEAIDTLTPATRSGGNDDRARASVALGRALLAAKRGPEADAAFEQAISWAPASPEVRSAIARAHLDAGNKAANARALALAEAAAALAPDIASVYLTLGRAQEANGGDADALASYERALRLDPTDRYARIRAIRLSLGRGDFAGARARVERLVSEAPEVPEHHFLLGLVAARAGRAEDARAAYGAAIERAHGDYPEAYFNLGALEAKQGAMDAAIAAYERAIALRPDYLEAYNNLGLLHTSAKDAARAEAAFKRAIELDPKYFPAWFNLGKAYGDFGRTDEAIAALERAVAVNPRARKARLELGVTYAQSQRLDEAIKTYRSLLAEETRYVAAIYDLALALEAKGDLEAAAAELERATTLDPEHVRSRRRLAGVRLKLGQPQIARQIAEDLLEREPSDRAARALLVRAHAAQGDTAACRAAALLAGPEPSSAGPADSADALIALCSGDHTQTATIPVATRSAP